MLARATIHDLARLLSGYREGTSGAMDAQHCATWLNQFEPSDRSFLLEETIGVLQTTYLDTNAVNTHVQTLLNAIAPLDSRGKDYWRDVTFAHAQRRSASQDYMTTIAIDLVENTVGVRPEIGDEGVHVVYLDDVSGTGQQMTQAISGLIREDLEGTTIHVAHVVSHTGDWKHRNSICDLAQQRGYRVQFHDAIRAENRRTYSANSHVLYPLIFTPQGYTAQWMRNFSSDKLEQMLRLGPGAGLFSSSDARQRYECIMLEKGAYICSLSSRNPRILPLGYDAFSGTGFGMLYATSRNCPNNCPLAWWWGDRTGTKPTLRNWYPLLDRRPWTDNA